MAGHETFDAGSEPLQSAALTIKLRNLLIHFKPETISVINAPKLESQLVNKFPQNSLMAGSGNPFFPDKCLGAGCVNWTVQSAKGFADETFRRLALEPNYQRVRWDDA